MTLEEELIHALYITGSITFEEAGLPEMAENDNAFEMIEIDTGFDRYEDMVTFLDRVIRRRLGIKTPGTRTTIECEDNLCRVYA